MQFDLFLTVVLVVCPIIGLGVALLLVRRLRLARGEANELKKELELLRAREHSFQVQAHYDGLTGLVNRRLVEDRFQLAVERAKRNRTSFALLVIELRDFSGINEQYGHAAGDAVLIAVARRLAGSVRASDTVVRLGGDQFVVLVESVDDQPELVRVDRKLFDALAELIVLDSGVLVNARASIGLALYPADGVTLDQLLRVARQLDSRRKSSKMHAAG